MSKPKFTPGPWKVHGATDRYGNVYAVDTVKDERGIFRVAQLGFGLEQLANARLIAQAPEMYRALERALMFLPDEIGADGYSDRVLIERILRDVEGKE